MANTYTTRGGLIQPEVGQNLNTWGGLLNTNNFPLIDKGIWGFESITVTGDFTLTRTDGDATSTQLNKGINLVGTPTADFTVTVLSLEHIIRWRNATGRNATIKVSAGTGVTLANGQTADLGYNANLGDITLVSPNRIGGDATVGGALTIAGKISGVVAGAADTDGVNKVQMENYVTSVLASITSGAGGVFFTRYTYTATGGETSKSGADDNGLTLAYTPGIAFVYLNGSLLVPGTEYVGTTGTSITGVAAMAPGDRLEVVALSAFSTSNTYTQAQTNALFGAPPLGIGSTTRTTGAFTTLSALVADDVEGFSVSGASHALRAISQAASVSLTATNAANTQYSPMILAGSTMRLRTDGITDTLTLNDDQSADFAGTVTINSGLTVEGGGADVTGDTEIAGLLTGNAFIPSAASTPTGGVGVYLPSAGVLGLAGDTVTLASGNVSRPVYWAVANNTSGGNAVSYAIGDGSNHGMDILTKGTGAFNVYTGTTSGVTGATQQFSVTHTASASRHITITGSNGGNPIISASAGNVTINTDSVLLGGGNASRPVYWSFGNNASGSSAFVFPISDVSNAGLDFVTKGSSGFGFYTGTSSGVTGATQQVSITHTASANRVVTMTGSNGGNPTISASGGNLAVGTSAWTFGVVNSVSPTSPNRTLTVTIGGTTYYIHAKTTND